MQLPDQPHDESKLFAVNQSPNPACFDRRRRRNTRRAGRTNIRSLKVILYFSQLCWPFCQSETRLLFLPSKDKLMELNCSFNDIQRPFLLQFE